MRQEPIKKNEDAQTGASPGLEAKRKVENQDMEDTGEIVFKGQLVHERQRERGSFYMISSCRG